MDDLPSDDIFSLDLSGFGAEGFTLRDRLDMTGHATGRIDPHINTDILGPDNKVLRRTASEEFGPADFRDLCNNQLPGFNGMQLGPD